MEIILKRPLFFSIIFYILGLIFGTYFRNLYLILTIFLLIYILNKTRKYFKLLLLICFSFGLIYIQIYSNNIDKQINKISDILENTVYYEAFIVSNPKINNQKVSYNIKIKFIKYNNNNYKINLKSVIYIDENAILNTGDKISGYGKLKLPQNATNSKVFDYKKYLYNKGIFFSLVSKKVDVQKNQNIILNIKNHIISTIDKYIDKNFSGFIKAIFIGYDTDITDEINEKFSISGISHIICVSGTHVGIIVILFRTILKKIKYNEYILISLLIIYCYITGYSASVIRASIMTICIITSKIFNRKSDTLTSLAISALILLIYNPFYIFDISFQLSYIATLGIILIYPNIKKLFIKVPTSIAEIISISISALIITIPISIFYFCKIYTYSLLANILVVPLASILIFLSFILCIFNLPIINIMCKVFAFFINIISTYFVLLPNLISKLPIAYINIIPLTIIETIIVYILISIAFIYFPYKNKKIINSITLITISIIVISIIQVTTKKIPITPNISFVDVGQGDFAVLKTKNQKVCIIDGGGYSNWYQEDYDIGDTVIPYLLKHNINKVEMAILSHSDNDHIQGIIRICEELKVNTLCISCYEDKSENLKKLIKIANKKNIKILKLKAGDYFELDGFGFSILHPSKKTENLDVNYNSLVFKIIYKKNSILFTGDIEKSAEMEIINKYQNSNILKSNLLKVAHHGSNTSSIYEFVNKVKPDISIISVGRNNTYGHPNKEVLENLGKVSKQILRTDLNGEINIKFYEKELKIKTNS